MGVYTIKRVIRKPWPYHPMCRGIFLTEGAVGSLGLVLTTAKVHGIGFRAEGLGLKVILIPQNSKIQSVNSQNTETSNL